MDVLSSLFTAQFGVMLLSAVAAFATVLTIALPTLSRDRTASRMKVMAVERDKMRAVRLSELNAAGKQQARLRQNSKGFMSQIVDHFNLRQAFETDDVKQKLKMAGLRGQAPLVGFVFFRFAMPIFAFLGALFYLFVARDHELPVVMRLGISLVAAYAGLYLPNVFIQNLISRRQQSINQAFPDALDLLLICVQSGMSSEAAFGKVAKEVATQSVELAEEFTLTTAELSYLPDRRQAFENLAKRTGIPSIKAVATSLIQAERYGTPVSQALRVMAKENRELRMAAAEKKAAALPPKLTVPMIVFFLPVLFVVIIGPAVIQYMNLKK
ncbi:MAG: type II secretion system F family protein [Hyphomicrobiaceae bacterium]